MRCTRFIDRIHCGKKASGKKVVSQQNQLIKKTSVVDVAD